MSDGAKAAEPAWVCPACKTTLVTPFCPQCGERPVRPTDLRLGKLAAKLLHATTSIDGKLLRTLWRLLRQPGQLTVDYVSGNRQPYIAPFQLFLLANVLFFAIQSLTGMNIFGSTLDSHLHHQDWSELAQSLVARHLERTHTTLELYAPHFDRAVVLYAKSLVILMALPFGLLLALVFLGNHKPFMTHVVFALHLYTFLLLLFSLAVLVAAASVLLGGPGLDAPMMDNLLSVFNLVVCAIYIHLASRPVFTAGMPARVLKAALLAVAAGAVVVGYRFVIFLITVLLT